MNRPTNNIILDTLVFFGIIIVFVGLFFGYKAFFVKDIISEKVIIDDGFNDIFNNQKEEYIKSEDNYVTYENKSCLFNEENFTHGRVNKFYSRPSVGIYESCEDFSEIKRCSDGQWLPESKFKYSSCEKTIDCTLDDETIIKNGQPIIMFSKNEVAFGDKCERYKQERICEEALLTGNDEFKFKKCKVSEKDICLVKDINGQIQKIPHNTGKLFFSQSIVAYDDDCKKYSRNRFCSNSILGGDNNFSFLTCQKTEPRSCFLSGVEIAHEQVRAFYSKSKPEGVHRCGFYYLEAKCDDGTLLKNDDSGEEFPEEYFRPSCTP